MHLCQKNLLSRGCSNAWIKACIAFPQPTSVAVSVCCQSCPILLSWTPVVLNQIEAKELAQTSFLYMCSKPHYPWVKHLSSFSLEDWRPKWDQTVHVSFQVSNQLLWTQFTSKVASNFASWFLKIPFQFPTDFCEPGSPWKLLPISFFDSSRFLSS